MYVYLCMQKTNNMKTNFENEWQRRMDLIQDIKFRELCIKYSKKIGITADEWNKNKAGILLYFANEFCAIENKSK